NSGPAGENRCGGHSSIGTVPNVREVISRGHTVADAEWQRSSDAGEDHHSRRDGVYDDPAAVRYNRAGVILGVGQGTAIDADLKGRVDEEKPRLPARAV